MSERTKGPWKIVRGTVKGERWLGIAMADAMPGTGIECICLISPEKTEKPHDLENAQRIIDCVTYCDGMDDPKAWMELVEESCKQYEAKNATITARIAELEQLLEATLKSHTEEQDMAVKAEAKVKELEGLMPEVRDAVVDLLNYVEDAPWTRHQKSEIDETKWLLTRIEKSLAPEASP